MYMYINIVIAICNVNGRGVMSHVQRAHVRAATMAVHAVKPSVDPLNQCS